MRNSIEKRLQNIWYSDSTPPWYLRMLVPLYRAGYDFDHRKSNSNRSDSKSGNSEHFHPDATLSTPLLVVGNITVGGSGKTPLVIALCKIAQDMGVSVGVASTGYGRKSTETLKVNADSDATKCGDEPVLIAIRTGAPVIVASRRQDAISRLRQMNLDLIISDDGLQTAGLHRDIEICVVDGTRGIGNAQLLPAGPLREPAGRLQQVDRIVSNGEWTSMPDDCNISQMDLVGDSFCSLNGLLKLSAVEFFWQHLKGQVDRSVHMFAAIGNPDRFFKAVRQLDLKASQYSRKAEHWHEHRFADHHTYEAADFDAIPNGATIVMTEKDAVKCRKLKLENAWYLPVDAELDDDFVQWYCQQLKLLKQDKP